MHCKHYFLLDTTIPQTPTTNEPIRKIHFDLTVELLYTSIIRLYGQVAHLFVFVLENHLLDCCILYISDNCQNLILFLFIHLFQSEQKVLNDALGLELTIRKNMKEIIRIIKPTLKTLFLV